MLHLAQVQITKPQNRAELVLLARQQYEYAWKVLPEPRVIPFINTKNYGENCLVLVTLSDLEEIIAIESATHWVLNIVQTFLRDGITPDFLQQERDWVEQGRQDLSLQYQDLDRRALELEARREQIEQLEETLKREKKQVEVLVAQCREQSQDLDMRMVELQARQEQLERLGENFNPEKRQSNIQPSN